MSRKKILLVDDDDDDQLIFSDALNEITSDVELIFSNNGMEAIDHLKSISPQPSLIFLDLNMPLMNGYECLKVLKSENEFKNIPVVIFTTSDNPKDEKKLMELGATRYLSKTANFQMLKGKIDEVLKKYL